MGYLSTDKKKITTKTFAEMKAAGEKVTMLTAYDFTTAGILDAAGIDSILIGDSASNVMAGNADTLPTFATETNRCEGRYQSSFSTKQIVKSK